MDCIYYKSGKCCHDDGPLNCWWSDVEGCPYLETGAELL